MYNTSHFWLVHKTIQASIKQNSVSFILGQYFPKLSWTLINDIILQTYFSFN